MDTEQPSKGRIDSVPRRRFVQTLFIIPAVAAFAGCDLGGDAHSSRASQYRPFFDPAERRFIEAATARLIPSDGGTAGAKEAAVGEFIDRQLSGSYGRADTWYMEGPWVEGSSEQGYQLRYTPAELYRIAIRDVENYCRQKFADKTFSELEASDQDRLLKALEQGKLDIGDRVPPALFFAVLWQNTQEGFLADPMYGGNRDFAGWKLIGFPGPRYNYVEEITQYGTRYPLPPVGLLGRDGTRTLRS